MTKEEYEKLSKEIHHKYISLVVNIGEKNYQIELFKSDIEHLIHELKELNTKKHNLDLKWQKKNTATIEDSKTAEQVTEQTNVQS